MNNKREIEIGEEVQVGSLKLICEECQTFGPMCPVCDLYHIYDSKDEECLTYIGECEKRHRTDNKNVIFRLKEE